MARKEAVKFKYQERTTIIGAGIVFGSILCCATGGILSMLSPCNSDKLVRRVCQK